MIVANPRKHRAIYQNERKSDRRDAMMLARLARMDPTLLRPLNMAARRPSRICSNSSCATVGDYPE